MCANCIVRESSSCRFYAWGMDCGECAQAKRGHCSFKTDPRKRAQTTSRLYDASKTSARRELFPFYLLIYYIDIFLDLLHLYNVAYSALATASHLTVLVDHQMAEARRTMFEVVELLGQASATESMEALEGVVLDTPESKEFIDSLIEIIQSPDFAGKIADTDMVSAAAMEQSFGSWESLPSDATDSEPGDNPEDAARMEIDLNSPPREFPPQPVASSSRSRLPALMPAASFRSLRSQASAQGGSAAPSSSSNVDSPQSGVSMGKKRSKFFYYFTSTFFYLCRLFLELDH